MKKANVNLKVFAVQFFAYFLLLNGLQTIFQLKNIKLAEILHSNNTFEDKISVIEQQDLGKSSGMLISDFVFFTTTFPYFLLLVGFIVFWFFNLRRRIDLLYFASSFLIILFFGGIFKKFLNSFLLNPTILLHNYTLGTIISGLFLIILSVLLFYFSNSNKLKKDA